MYPGRDSYLFTLAELYAEAGRDRAALNALRAAIRSSERWKGDARASTSFQRFRGTEEFEVLTGG
jgi:hypothetical protein